MASTSVRILVGRSRLALRRFNVTTLSCVCRRPVKPLDISGIMRQARCLTLCASVRQNNKGSESKSTSSDIDFKREDKHTSIEAGVDMGSDTSGQPSTEEKSLGLFKRFRDAYKEHGKVLVGVHLVTSAVWTSIFYYAAATGVDVTPLLAKIGVSDSVIEYLGSTVGNLATAYVMYKIATPARYTVTIFGTYTTVHYLQKWGYIEKPTKEDRLRSLVKEKYTDIKDDVKDKYTDMKEDVRDKYDDFRDDVKDKIKVRMKKKTP